MPAKTLEMCDVSSNKLTSLATLEPCVDLVTLAVDDNKLETLSELPFAGLGRLITLTASMNRIASLDAGVGLLVKMETCVLSENPFTELPSEFATCKKLKDLKIDGCPVKVRVGREGVLEGFWEGGRSNLQYPTAPPPTQHHRCGPTPTLHHHVTPLRTHPDIASPRH